MQTDTLIKKILKGFIIGIGKIIPGVSGAMMAIAMGIYDKMIEYIINFRKHKKESMLFLFPVGFGTFISIILFSKIINFMLDRYYALTMFFFIGLIMGGIPIIDNKIKKKNYFLIILGLFLFLFISFISIKTNFINDNYLNSKFIFILSGILEAIGTIVPGISSTALLLSVGTYNTILYSIGNITNIINVIIPFVIGIVIGILLLLKLINYLFKKYNNNMYSFILGILISNTIFLIYMTIININSLIEILIGIIIMVFGIYLGNLFEKK